MDIKVESDYVFRAPHGAFSVLLKLDCRELPPILLDMPAISEHVLIVLECFQKLRQSRAWQEEQI